MAWAVHWLHAETLVLNLKQVDVVFIVLVVTRSLPKLEVEHVGSDDLIVSTNTVLITDQFDELVVDLGTVRIPETAAR